MKEAIKKIKNKKGFIILFAVTLSSIILAISLGIANIALQEIVFSTSARETNEAFFAADTGAECALANDKPLGTSFVQSGGSGTIQCLGGTVNLSGSWPSWDFVLSALGNSGQSCVKVNVFKDDTTSPPDVRTTITSRGYNLGDSSCAFSSQNRIERELKVRYSTNPSASVTTVSITANPASVSYEGSSTIVWTSTNATTCTASGDWSGSKATSGSELKSNLTSPINSYTLTCTGASGSVNATATVTVGPQPPHFLVDAGGTLTNNLIAYWKMEEAGGTRIDSKGGNNLSDSGINPVDSAAGKVGNAGYFNFAGSPHLSIADNLALSTGNISFTLAAWVRLADLGADRVIISKRDVSSGQPREYALLFNTNDQKFRFQTFLSDGSGGGPIVANVTPSIDTWYLVVGWRDSTSPYTLHIQVNNGTVYSMNENTNAGPPSDTAASVRVGAFDTALNGVFYGRIDEIGFWKRVLTAQERTDLYNGGTGNTYVP